MAEKTPVGDMPRMVPDRDDIRRRASSQPVDRKSPSAAPNSANTQGGHSWVMVTLLIIAGIAIGYLALQQYSMSQLLNSYEERLSLADDRIVSLEQSLTQTDESVALNGTAINAQFKAIKAETDMQMSEIRKLWDVTNKRNRTWIEENQASLAKQEKSVAAIETAIKALEAAQSSDEKMLASLSQQLTSQTEQFTAVQQSMQDSQQQMDSMNRAMESLLSANYEERILTLTLTQENLLSEQSKITDQATGNRAQIDDILSSLQAVDAGRLETNKRLSALSTRLDTLNARVTALTGTAP